MKVFVVTITVLLVLTTMFALITGANWLSEELITKIPNGNIMVAVSLVSLSTTNLVFLSKERLSKKVALLSLLLAIAWYPVGIIWSGNWKLNFVSYGEYWLPFSYFVAATSLFSVALNLISIVAKWFQKSDKRR